MNAGTGKIEINIDWYNEAKLAQTMYLNGMDFFSNDPRWILIDELAQVETDILTGKAVLV